jgi:hypothetical protein
MLRGLHSSAVRGREDDGRATAVSPSHWDWRGWLAFFSSCSARNQSSTSRPGSRPRSSNSSYARRAIASRAASSTRSDCPESARCCVLVAIFVPSYMRRSTVRGSPGMPELFRKNPEQACDRLTFRCLAKLHATRHIRATRNEPLFRVVLLRGIGLEIQNETAGFQNERRSL